MVNTLSIIFTLIGLVLGVGLGFILRKKKSKGLIEKAMQEANQIRNKAKSDAESMKKEKILQAKERFIELKSEHEKVILDREKKVVLFVLVLQVLDNVALVVLEEMAPGSQDW